MTAALDGLTLAPTADWNGTTALNISTSDGIAPAVANSVAITVSPVADITADTQTTPEDTARTFNALANDTFEAWADVAQMTFARGAVVNANDFGDGYAHAEPRDDFDTAIFHGDTPWEAVDDWEDVIRQAANARVSSQIDRVWAAIAMEYERERNASPRKENAPKDIDPAGLDWLLTEGWN